jgi:hypothetical protein
VPGCGIQRIRGRVRGRKTSRVENGTGSRGHRQPLARAFRPLAMTLARTDGRQLAGELYLRDFPVGEPLAQTPFDGTQMTRYSAELLFSAEARSTFIGPDREPIPGE